MNKWIDERTWKIAVYLCYVLGFVVLSGAGYNVTMGFVGDTTLPMKMVILLCVCLTVALIMFLFFSAFITPFSELLFRLLKRFQRAEGADGQIQLDDEVSKGTENETAEDNAPQKDSQSGDLNEALADSKNTLRSQFMARYVADDHKKELIYDTIDQALNEREEGAFAAKLIIAAANYLKWLSSMPSGEKMAYFFGEQSIHSKSSYDTAKSNFKNASEAELSEAITILCAKLKVNMEKKLEEAKGKH